MLRIKEFSQEKNNMNIDTVSITFVLDSNYIAIRRSICKCGVLSVAIHSTASAVPVAPVAVRPAALVPFRDDAAADLVTGPDVGRISHNHHGEGDQQQDEGSLECRHC